MSYSVSATAFHQGMGVSESILKHENRPVPSVFVFAMAATLSYNDFLTPVYSPFQVCLRHPLYAGFTTLAFYLIACRVFRFRRVRKLENKYGKKTTETDGMGTVGRPDITLNPQEMQEIMFTSLEYDMPGLMNYALTFALFKTYGIVSVLNPSYIDIAVRVVDSMHVPSRCFLRPS